MKNFLIVFIALFLVSGCSKENKNSSDEIKIEQQNPPQKETPPQNIKEEVKSETNTEAAPETEKLSDKQSQPRETQKEEAVFLKAKQTLKYIGKNAVVTGYIADVYKNEKVAYLNFDGKFPKNTCAAVIFKDDFGKFGDVKRFKNKNVTVSGIISEYNGKPQIVLKSTSQVKITD